MAANTVTLTVRSINNGVLASSIPVNFVVNNIHDMQANQNLLTTPVVTEAGDTASQLSAWEIYGAEGATLGWSLTNVSSTRTVRLYSNTNHNVIVAEGSGADGVIYLYSKNESGITGKVTVSYSADDIDAANTVKVGTFVASKDLQLPGTTQITYYEGNSRMVKYTVDETVADINTMINGDAAYMEATYDLTNAQIRTLGTVPVDIIAAPGAGFAIEVISAFVNYTYATDAFTGNLTADLVYTTTANEIGTATNAFSGTTSKITKFVTSAGVLTENEGVSIKMDTGDPTVGGTEAGTAVVKITYKIAATA